MYLWKSLWVALIAIGFVLVFKAQLSGAKFNVVAELRAPTTDLCDLWFVCGSRNRVCEFILCSGLA